MSGGVDSSLVVALLKEEGYDLIGVTMRLWHSEKDMIRAEENAKGCCNAESVEDAFRVASKFDVPYYVLNFTEPFEEKVVKYFIEEYQRGRTPNPCIACNRYMKFDLLLNKGKALEVDYIATGHYARVKFDEASGRYLLLKSADHKKDQTYALYNLTQEQLKHTLFPLGDFRKEETRKLATKLGLKVADKPDSQEICFIPDDDYKGFLKNEIKEPIKPGPIYDTNGKLLGEHKGIPFYTIGQRKGLGLALGEPVYVIEINPEKNSLVVGRKEEQAVNGLWAEDLNFIGVDSISSPMEVTAKIRYNAPEEKALVYPPQGGQLKVEFNSPVNAVTPGQSVVFYQDEVVIGGGIIKESI